MVSGVYLTDKAGFPAIFLEMNITIETLELYCYCTEEEILTVDRSSPEWS